MAEVSVIGSGSRGTAISVSLALAGHSVILWSRRADFTAELYKRGENLRYLPGVKIPDNVKFTSDISECVNSDIIVIAVPSHTVRSVSAKIAPFIAKKQIIVSISKGFDEEKYKKKSNSNLSVSLILSSADYKISLSLKLKPFSKNSSAF